MTEQLTRWVAALTRPKKILVVDDDEYIRTMFQLAAKGFHVDMEFAPSAREAKLKLRDFSYDFIFLDMKLEMAVSGMEVLQYVNAAHKDVNVVIMSGSISLHDIMHEANGLGVLSFIRKPTQFTLTYLSSVFNKLGFQPSGDDPPSSDEFTADMKL